MKLRKITFTLFILTFIGGNCLAQISPGALSSVHRHLEGMSNCTKCHDLGKKVSNNKCLDCHTELKARVIKNKGYHSSKAIKGKECATCHSDHHGLNFKIITLEGTKFNHKLTGFVLKDAHKKKKCSDCHTPKYISNTEIKAKKFTFLGLQTKCISCHEDVHQKTLSVNCNNCHNVKKFKPAAKFNHDKAKFKLVGKHKTVDCIKCHKKEIKNGKKIQKFTGLKFGKCTDCHKDVHDNQFGQNCTKCHTVESFQKIKATANFDHNKTRYKLKGRHQGVDCKLCHKRKYTDPLKYAKCVNCHQDFHENQFEKEGITPDCASCHNVKGFEYFSYTIKRHNESPFVLKGAHNATPCFDCHKKEDKWTFRKIGERCIDCHSDIHKEIINKKYYPDNECKSCHSELRWSTIEFDHTKTKFELLGAHKTQTCRDCHFKESAENTIQQKFENLSMNCISCHTDAHYKQFEKNGTTDCNKCHNSKAFKPALKFDHNTTKFKLIDKHENVACIKCHKPTKKDNNIYIKYKIQISCESCHS